MRRDDIDAQSALWCRNQKVVKGESGQLRRVDTVPTSVAAAACPSRQKVTGNRGLEQYPPARCPSSAASGDRARGLRRDAGISRPDCPARSSRLASQVKLAGQGAGGTGDHPPCGNEGHLCCTRAGPGYGRGCTEGLKDCDGVCRRSRRCRSHVHPFSADPAVSFLQ